MTSRLGGALTLGADYDVTLTAKTVTGTTTITLAVMRVSDSFYLQPGGTFTATVANCFSVTDTTVAQAAGEYGVYSYAASAGNIAFTNFTAIAAP